VPCLLSRLLTAVGVKDHIIIETKDAVLVTHKDSCQDVKAPVNELKKKGCSEALYHKKIYRPWGSYEGMDYGEDDIVRYEDDYGRAELAEG